MKPQARSALPIQYNFFGPIWIRCLWVKRMVLLFLCLVPAVQSQAAEVKQYPPARMVYDLSFPDQQHLKNILDRAGFLQCLYNNDTFEASIIIVVHEAAIPLFVRHNRHYADLMSRANGLSMGEIIQFRLCRASATLQGFKPEDFADFIRLVSMADAEIVQLQGQGYAYLK